MKLRTLQDWVVRPAFLRVNGVADVVSIGGLQREIHVQPDPSRLAAHGLTLASLEQGIRNGSVNASGGVLERGAEQLVIRSEGLFTSVEDLKAVRLATEGGTPVFVKDVATVTEGWSPRQGVVSRNESMDTVQGVVLMRRGENPSAVLKRIRAAVHDIDRNLAPEGVKLDRSTTAPTWWAPPPHRGAQPARGRGAGDPGPVRLPPRPARRAGGGHAHPALSSHLVHLPAPQRDERKLLSMGAVDFGVIVDGGVVIVEAILARLAVAGLVWVRPGGGAEDPRGHHRGGAADGVCPADHHRRLPAHLSPPAGGGPDLLADGKHRGLGAGRSALLLGDPGPGALRAGVAKAGHHGESPLLTWGGRRYDPALRYCLRHPALLLGSVSLLLVGAALVLPRLGSEFLPELNEGALYMTFTLPPNSSLTEGRKLVPRITQLLQRAPQVESVLSQLGRPEDGTDAKLANNLEFFVKLTPPGSLARGDAHAGRGCWTGSRSASRRSRASR
jgi:cobalt-zinc-cadmium resistance protein CzcA